MKWYSIKRYKPAHTVTECLVRTRAGSCYIGHNCEMNDGSYEWNISSGEEEGLDEVTHFCIFDPIEIEE